MGFFNPIVYFVKSFIRFFIRKFFWLLIIILAFFVGFMLFHNKVFAADSSIHLNTSFVNDNVINTARAKIGSNIWNNEDYDVFIARNNNNTWVSYYNAKNSVSDNDLRLRLQAAGDWLYLSYFIDGVYQNHFNFQNADCYWISLDNNYSDSSSNDARVPCSKSGNDLYVYVVRSHYDIVDSVGNLISPNTVDFVTNPYFITTDQELQTYDFDFLQINGGTTEYEIYYELLDQTFTAEFNLVYNYKGVSTNIEILPEYISVNTRDNTWQINIPYNALTNKVVVRNGETFSYTFSYKIGYESAYSLSTGQLVYNLTTEQENNINQDSEKQLQGEILQTQQETNDKLDNLDNTINNSNIDNSNVDDFSSLGGDFNTNDNTGIDGLFQMLYDAFCTTEEQDLTFTIPFTNQEVTINASNISDNYPVALKNFVGVFVWGLIGLYVLKDIRGTIDKISEGSPENVGSDVKKEVL